MTFRIIGVCSGAITAFFNGKKYSTNEVIELLKEIPKSCFASIAIDNNFDLAFFSQKVERTKLENLMKYHSLGELGL